MGDDVIDPLATDPVCPIEESGLSSHVKRALIADSILRSLNTPDPDIDALWAEVAMRRRDELRSGKTQPIPGDDAFKRIRERYA